MDLLVHSLNVFVWLNDKEMLDYVKTSSDYALIFQLLLNYTIELER